MGFNDHFSALSRPYAEFRPTYPPALAAFLAETAPGRERAWDCGTGSGQAAELVRLWPDAREVREIRWPIDLVAGRV